MKVVEAAGQYDEWQIAFISQLMEDVKRELESANLDAAQVRDLTEKISFTVACLIDGSSTVVAGDEELSPILTFGTDDDDLITCGGNSYMHEYVFGISNDMFGERAL